MSMKSATTRIGVALSAAVGLLRSRLARKASPLAAFPDDAARVAVFCGSSLPSDSALALEVATACEALGKEMAFRNIELVYGGGTMGIMGAIASAVSRHGGKVIAVMPRALMSKERGMVEGASSIIVDSMHERKELMAVLSTRGFIALPGGYGTFDEAVEMITWTQLGIHSKPVGFLNVLGYFEGLIAQANKGMQAGLIPASAKDVVVVRDDAVRLLTDLLTHTPPPGYLQAHHWTKSTGK